jgi:uncharacterized protein
MKNQVCPLSLWERVRVRAACVKNSSVPDFSPPSPHPRPLSQWERGGFFFHALLRIPAWLLIGFVRLYQWLISPALGRRCRFEPSCSTYFVESVRKYGAVRGACRGIWRICRCNPWNPGGYDPP